MVPTRINTRCGHCGIFLNDKITKLFRVQIQLVTPKPMDAWQAGSEVCALMAKNKKAPKAASTERKILFYRLNAGKGASGKPLLVDLLPALKHIQALPFSEAGKYHTFGDGNALACWVDRLTAPLRFRLVQIRRSGLPGIESQGEITPLSIPLNSGLAEVTHFVVFDSGIVGAEFNFYGPRPSRLPGYLSAKCGKLVPDFSCDALLKRDIDEQLKQLTELKLFQLRIDPSYVSVVEKANESLGAAFKAALEAGEADAVEIILRRSGRKINGPGLTKGLIQTVKKLAGHKDLQEHVDSFKVKGVNVKTEKLELIDVLSDELVAYKDIPRLSERSRQLQDGAAFAAIEESYGDLKTDLLVAASINL
jgi:hypothetical protein